MRVEVMCGDKNKAVDWFEKSEIPGLGGKTAAQAVKDGDGDAVLQHLNDMDNGVYA